MAKIGYLQVTRNCNQECIICSNPANNRTLGLQKAKQAIDELKTQKYGQVILTGGEPTLYDELPQLIKYCLKKKIFPRVITNGQRTSNFRYLRALKKAGLRHLHLSVYSCQDKIQARISRNKTSLVNIKKSLANLQKIGGITTDINITISRYNANHLSKIVSWLINDYHFIGHFVFNNLDPLIGRAAANYQVIPRLNDFELELHQALKMLEKNKKTFRVERAPLCYLTEFEHVCTETRKIIKNESRLVYFLDKRGKFIQENWVYGKAECCQVCFLNDICAGLYQMDKYYSATELYPVFVSKEKIIQKVLNN